MAPGVRARGSRGRRGPYRRADVPQSFLKGVFEIGGVWERFRRGLEGGGETLALGVWQPSLELANEFPTSHLRLPALTRLGARQTRRDPRLVACPNLIELDHLLRLAGRAAHTLLAGFGSSPFLGPKGRAGFRPQGRGFRARVWGGAGLWLGVRSSAA